MASSRVLVVGGGLAGLSCAMFLAMHHVPVTLVERHAGTSMQPRARGQSPLTMEALAAARVDQQVLAVSPADRLHVVIAESLVGRELDVILADENPDFSRFSPRPWALASQEQLEPILARRAAQLGAQLSFSTELEGVEQDSHGVQGSIRDLKTGDRSTIEASYLVAADGHRGRIREMAGIGTHGPGDFGRVYSILFLADLSEPLQNRRFALYHLKGAVPGATFVTTDENGRYALHVHGGQEPPSRDHAIELIRRALGLPNLMITVLDIASWTVSLRIADRFVQGRIALVGDAAKLMPPTGGFGGNAAVLDSYSLAWKLAALTRGHAGPGLLSSHDTERRPFAEMIAAEQFAQMRYRSGDNTAAAPNGFDFGRALFGYRYPKGAVATEANDDNAPTENPATPTGRPGSRAAYVRLPGPHSECAHRPSGAASTTDLFGHDFVLLAGSTESVEAAATASARLGIPIRSVLMETPHATDEIDTDAAGFQWPDAYGVSATGASLIRPDGIIAWRSNGTATVNGMIDALNRTLDIDVSP